VKRLHTIRVDVHTSPAMTHHLVGFDTKKKLWRPCRKARALGL